MSSGNPAGGGLGPLRDHGRRGHADGEGGQRAGVALQSPPAPQGQAGQLAGQIVQRHVYGRAGGGVVAERPRQPGQDRLQRQRIITEERCVGVQRSPDGGDVLAVVGVGRGFAQPDQPAAVGRFPRQAHEDVLGDGPRAARNREGHGEG